MYGSAVGATVRTHSSVATETLVHTTGVVVMRVHARKRAARMEGAALAVRHAGLCSMSPRSSFCCLSLSACTSPSAWMDRARHSRACLNSSVFRCAK